MSFAYYAVLIVVSLSSVVFGLDWLSDPPPAWKPVAVATVKQPAKQPAKQAVKQATSQPAEQSAPTKDAGPTVTATTTQQDATRPQSSAAATPDTSTAGDNQKTAMAPANTDSAAVAPEPGPEPAATAAPRCDVQACSAAYFTFDPNDCTYQPIDGPRRLCTKGTPPPASTARDSGQETTTDTAVAPQVSNKCDIDACKKAYFTFDPADCTYQPTNGPRRLCTKGTPPAPDAAQAPAQDSKPDEPQVAVSADTPPDVNAAQTPNQETTTDTAAAPQVSNKCDIDACKKAYFTFDPADCTYQPTNGPRRLCTRGTPPRPDAAQDTKPDEPDADSRASVGAAPAESGSADTGQQVSDKCDIDACKKAYFTFDPSDCTYQPTTGPRRLCTRGTPPQSQAARPRAAPDRPVPPGLVPSAR
jgi:hypothetical protein